MKENALVLFMRYPEKGRVKTRLAAEVGDDMAYELYLCFLADTLEGLDAFEADPVIAGAGNSEAVPADLLKNVRHIAQRGHDLGKRMSNAFHDVFAMGYIRAAIIGSDIPGLPPGSFKSAFDELAGHDIVLGPSRDGGYYLVAFSAAAFEESIFENIQWSTPRVLADTLEKADQCGLRTYLLSQLEDIDDLDSLIRFYEKQHLDGVGSHTLRCVDKHKEKLYGKIRL
jgi:rSAM/selenodomain-associated transferase 1